MNTLQIIIAKQGPVDMGKLRAACLQSGMAENALPVMEGYFGKVVQAYAAPDAPGNAINVGTPVSTTAVEPPLETNADTVTTEVK